jgi:hypothetical protein
MLLGLNCGGTDTVAADGDQWEESFNDGGFYSCDLRATSSGEMSCLEIIPIESNGTIIFSTEPVIETHFSTFQLMVESSIS